MGAPTLSKILNMTLIYQLFLILSFIVNQNYNKQQTSGNKPTVSSADTLTVDTRGVKVDRMMIIMVVTVVTGHVPVG